MTACTAATAIKIARLRRFSLGPPLLSLDCKVPDLNIHLALGVLYDSVLAGFQLFLGPDLIQVAIELLFQDLGHGQLFLRLVDHWHGGETCHNPNRALAGYFGDSEALRLGELDVEFLLRVGEDVERMGALQLERRLAAD